MSNRGAGKHRLYLVCPHLVEICHIPAWVGHHKESYALDVHNMVAVIGVLNTSGGSHLLVVLRWRISSRAELEGLPIISLGTRQCRLTPCCCVDFSLYDARQCR